MRRRIRIAKDPLHHAAFFLQEEHFEQIAHRFGVADDVVPDRLLAEGFEQAWRGLEDLELFFGSFGVDDTGNAQRPWVTQESDKRVCFDGSSRRA